MQICSFQKLQYLFQVFFVAFYLLITKEKQGISSHELMPALQITPTESKRVIDLKKRKTKRNNKRRFNKIRYKIKDKIKVIEKKILQDKFL